MPRLRAKAAFLCKMVGATIPYLEVSKRIRRTLKGRGRERKEEEEREEGEGGKRQKCRWSMEPLKQAAPASVSTPASQPMTEL